MSPAQIDCTTNRTEWSSESNKKVLADRHSPQLLFFLDIYTGSSIFDKKLALKRNFLEGNLYFRRRKSHSCWTGGSKRPEGGLHFLAPLLGGAPFPNVKFFRQILMLWSSNVSCQSGLLFLAPSPTWDPRRLNESKVIQILIDGF